MPAGPVSAAAAAPRQAGPDNPAGRMEGSHGSACPARARDADPSPRNGRRMLWAGRHPGRTRGLAVVSAVVLLVGLALLARPDAPGPRLVLWAWERPEDLRFAGPGVSVAVLAGTVILSADAVAARPRLQALRVAPGQRLVGTVHVEIDRNARLAWTAAQRATASAAVLDLAADARFTELQVDFEVRTSEHAVLLDLLRAVRAGLAPGRTLSMTALASWCDTDAPWLDDAPVDDIVPMLFRMGRGGAALRERLAAGGWLRNPRCATSLGLATDTPRPALLRGRRLFVFDPVSWQPDALQSFRRSLR